MVDTLENTKLKKTEKIVRAILEESEHAREDDFYLVMRVYIYKNPELAHLELIEVLARHRLYDLPPFETITRCRRKIQEKHPELCNEKTRIKRQEQIKEYTEYALEHQHSKYFNRRFGNGD